MNGSVQGLSEVLGRTFPFPRRHFLSVLDLNPVDVAGLLDLAEGSGFHAVFARIEASGTASRALHARCGFELVGIERETGRKFNRWLDVALMECVLHERRGRSEGSR